MTERQESGTPNIPGILSLGVVAGILRRIGMDTIRAHEEPLIAWALRNRVRSSFVKSLCGP